MYHVAALTLRYSVNSGLIRHRFRYSTVVDAPPIKAELLEIKYRLLIEQKLQFSSEMIYAGMFYI